MALVIGTVGPGPCYSAQIVPSRDSALAQAFLSLIPDTVTVRWYDLPLSDRDALTEAIERLRQDDAGATGD